MVAGRISKITHIRLVVGFNNSKALGIVLTESYWNELEVPSVILASQNK